MPWRPPVRGAGRGAGELPIRRLVAGMFDKSRRWTCWRLVVFEAMAVRAKKIAAYHQYHASSNQGGGMYLRSASRRGPAGSAWCGYQGAARSLSMVFYAGTIAQERRWPTRPSWCSPTQRTDDQLFGTFAGLRRADADSAQQGTSRERGGGRELLKWLRAAGSSPPSRSSCRDEKGEAISLRTDQYRGDRGTRPSQPVRFH